MKILVLGGEGMLGHKMFQTLTSRYPDTICTIRGSKEDHFYKRIPIFEPQRIIDRINVMELSVLKQMLSIEKPAFVINCVGVVKQRDEAKSSIPSITINSLLPHLLAEWSMGWNGRVIHFSTDCVFSGNKGSYSEETLSDAEDLYGKSKFLGEVTAENALTLRTSIIGRELKHFRSLLEWFLSQKGKKVKGFRRVIYSGVTTNYLSDLVGNIISDHPNLSGLYQVTSPAIAKHDLLIRIRDAYKLDIDISPDDSEVSDRSMNGERFRIATGYSEPSWDALIKQLTDDKTPYHEWQKEN